MEAFIRELPDKVYHGTLSIYKTNFLRGIDLNRGQETVDFGRGFYTTTNYQQALSFARFGARKHNRQQKRKINQLFANPMIITYNINKSYMRESQGLVFSKPDNNWAEFIFNNRMGRELLISDFHNLNNSYDFVYGKLADAAIAILLEEVKQCLNHTNFITLNKEEKYNNKCYKHFCNDIQPYDQYNQDQISIHTPAGLKCLEINDLRIIKEGR